MPGGYAHMWKGPYHNGRLYLEMLRRTVDFATYRMEEKHQRLHLSIDPDIPDALCGDDQRLAQVLTNLLSNAVKFTPEAGDIFVTIRLEEEDEDSCRVAFSVRDNGIGIAPAQQARLFRAFEQAGQDTSRTYGGSGLGLAISKRIVEMMNGHIGVHSEPGVGSDFYFDVQIALSQEVLPSLGMGVNWATVRVLFVDDDEETLAYLGAVSARIGLRYDAASSAEEALRLIEERGQYNIYFIDWKMPGMSGLELTQRIRAQAGGGNSVVAMISGGDFSSVEQDAKAVGATKFLQKPLFPSDVADLISECLGAPSAVENDSGYE
jgi:CheY-like chemotaxis protein